MALTGLAERGSTEAGERPEQREVAQPCPCRERTHLGPAVGDLMSAPATLCCPPVVPWRASEPPRSLPARLSGASGIDVEPEPGGAPSPTTCAAGDRPRRNTQRGHYDRG